MKRIFLAVAIGMGIFTVATSSANNNVSSDGTNCSAKDTIRPDTVKKPKPDTVMLSVTP